MTNVLVEGGGQLLGAFTDAGLIDEYHVFIAPTLIGGALAPGPLQGRGAERYLVLDRPIRSDKRLREGACDFWEPFFLRSMLTGKPATQ